MCGRYNVIDNPGLRQLLRDLGVDAGPVQPAGVNLAPTESVPLLRDVAGVRALAPARWWLTPSWAPAVDQKYAMFNARGESLASSRAFRHPFRCQRGILPMSSFIEWRSEDGGRRPWLVSAAEGALAVAALWDVWERGDTPVLSCTLVTTAAAVPFQPWHRRMPVILAADECERWLDNARPLPADDPLLRSELKMPLRLQPLAGAVGNARRKEPALLDPVGAAVLIGG